MAVQSTMKNMVLCLSGVCLVCAAVLAGVYALTFAPIEQTEARNLAAAVGKVLPEAGGVISAEDTVLVDGTAYTYYRQVDTAGRVNAYAVKSVTIGFGGPLTVMVGLLPDGTVWNTSVLSQSETPGLGAKCSSDPAFTSQWHGFGPDRILKVRKDGGDVDAITASTITSRAFTLAVANAVAAVKTLEDNE